MRFTHFSCEQCTSDHARTLEFAKLGGYIAGPEGPVHRDMDPVLCRFTHEPRQTRSLRQTSEPQPPQPPHSFTTSTTTTTTTTQPHNHTTTTNGVQGETRASSAPSEPHPPPSTTTTLTTTRCLDDGCRLRSGRQHRKCLPPEGATAADALASRAAVAPNSPGCSDAPQRAAQGKGGGGRAVRRATATDASTPGDTAGAAR